MDMLTNHLVVDVLRRIGHMLELLGEDFFRVRAYHRAAENIEMLGEDIVDLWREGRLREIPGVGEALAKKIDELVRTGHLEYAQQLEAQVPAGVVDLLQIPSVGPKTARVLWLEGSLESLAEVKAAAEAGELRELPGVGARSEERILKEIEKVTESDSGQRGPDRQAGAES